jgi:hypothetical protein
MPWGLVLLLMLFVVVRAILRARPEDDGITPRMRDSRFFKLVEEHYRFLIEDYGFSPLCKKSDRVVLAVRYVNGRTIVEICRERREAYVMVQFHVLADREVPEPSESMLGYRLEAIVRLRCPGMLQASTAQTPDEEVEDRLAMTATALRECANDVLRGDYGILDEVADMERQRRAEVMKPWNEQLPPADDSH